MSKRISTSEIDLHPAFSDFLTSLPMELSVKEVDGEEVYYFMAGKNASHEFYLGQNAEGTRFYRGSFGEDFSLLKDVPAGASYDLPWQDEVLWLNEENTSTLAIELRKRGFETPGEDEPNEVWQKYGLEEERVFRELFADHNRVQHWSWSWESDTDPDRVLNGYTGHY